MYAYFQKHHNFKGIFFSSSPAIIQMCQKYNITVIPHYQSNPFHIPLIRDLFLQSSQFYKSRFYGYVNSDIVMSPAIFDFLTEVETRMESHRIPENVDRKRMIDK